MFYTKCMLKSVWCNLIVSIPVQSGMAVATTVLIAYINYLAAATSTSPHPF